MGIRNTSSAALNGQRGLFLSKELLYMAEIVSRIVILVLLIINHIKGGRKNA